MFFVVYTDHQYLLLIILYKYKRNNTNCIFQLYIIRHFVVSILYGIVPKTSEFTLKTFLKELLFLLDKSFDDYIHILFCDVITELLPLL